MRYKFRYRSIIFKIANGIIIPFQNYLIVRIILFLLLTLMAELGFRRVMDNETVKAVTVGIITYVPLLCMIPYCVLRKGVYLYFDHLVIARYTITTRNWKSRIKINYADIESAYINYQSLAFTRKHGSLLVPLGDSTCNVVITLHNGKQYYFSIENQEEFVEEVKKKIDMYNVCEEENVYEED